MVILSRVPFHRLEVSECLVTTRNSSNLRYRTRARRNVVTYIVIFVVVTRLDYHG